MSEARQKAETVISAWRDAFQAMNGRPAPRVSYERGWFIMFDPFVVRYRRAQMEAFTERLRQRRAPIGEDREAG